MGICGGYQMLGHWVHDPDGVEGEAGSTAGLGLLDTETTLTQEKQLTNVSGQLHLDDESVAVTGYEIHVGRTVSVSNETRINPLIKLTNGTEDGVVSECNQILGTYLHGIFDTFSAARLICQWAGARGIQTHDHLKAKEQAIDRIADAIEAHLDLALLWPQLDEN